MLSELSSNRKKFKSTGILPSKGFVCSKVGFGIGDRGTFDGAPSLIIELADSGYFFSIDELVTKLKAHVIKNVVIRGVEPFAAEYLAEFIKIVETIRVDVQVEGTGLRSYGNYIGMRNTHLWTTLSGPTYGGVEYQDLTSLGFARDHDGVIFKVKDVIDFQWMLTVLKSKVTKGNIHIHIDKDVDGDALENLMLFSQEMYLLYPVDKRRFKIFVR